VSQSHPSGKDYCQFVQKLLSTPECDQRAFKIKWHEEMLALYPNDHVLQNTYREALMGAPEPKSSVTSEKIVGIEDL